MVREFSLMNEKGAEFSLMDMEKYCLLTEPSGLGYSYNTTYTQMGNTFFTNLRKVEQGRINGIVNCLSYLNFRNLINFIESAEKLRFCYFLPIENESKVYFKDVQIASVEKSEKDTDGVIKAPITFDCLSLWYTNQEARYDMSPQDREIRWDFTWDSKFISYSSRRLEIVNNGHVDAPIEVAISGEVENPEIEFYVDGKLYQTVSFAIRLEEFEKLLYGTKENEFYIYKENTDGTLTDLFNLDIIDFYNDNVIRIPKNRSCEIRLNADNDISYARINVYIYYKAI